MQETSCEFLVEMNDIRKSFKGIPAVDGVTFRLRAGSVHALLGENGAGKSTLMKILSGLYTPDEGHIIYKGAELLDLNPNKALAAGISMIHQELSPIAHMSIRDNIFLGRELRNKVGLIDFATMNRETKRLLNDVGVDYDPKAKMNTLSIAEMQMVEITKSVFRNASVFIMDEPTSSLTDTEIEMLFRQIRMLKEQGKSIIYISHKMSEVFEITDEITILRDGKWVDTAPTAEYDMQKVVTQMVGRSITQMYPKEKVPIGKPVFSVRDFSGSTAFDSVSFDVHAGEILGFSGLVGAGRTEVMRAIFGLDPHTRGEVILQGKPVKIRSVDDAIANGIAMVLEDRKEEGLVLCRSISENFALPNLKQLSSFGFLDRKKEKTAMDSMVQKLSIKLRSTGDRVDTLSGGNQQKVVLAKWLFRDLKVVILDEPTRGIDVGAKAEIYGQLVELAKMGIAVIFISSEMPELLGMCDRIVVMSRGKITGELPSEQFDQEEIMKLAIANY